MNLKSALHDLNSQGYFIWDDFLSHAEIDDVKLDYLKIYKKGSFSLAGVGNEKDVRNASGNIRSDETYWLDSLALTTPQALFWDRLELLKKEINETLFLGLWTFDGHYSYYPVNGRYQKHLDRFNNNDQRTISMVLYFNSDWIVGDGGELRFHLDHETNKVTDVAPMAGRLVCFLSSKVLHEVLLTHKVRHSFAGWWKRRSI